MMMPAGPEVSLGRLASVEDCSRDVNQGISAVRLARDVSGDNDCFEVALGEAASRTTRLPCPEASLGRLASVGVGSRDVNHGVSVVRLAGDSGDDDYPEVALGEAASRTTTLPHHEVSLGRLASVRVGSCNTNSGARIVKLAQGDTSSNDDCLVVALGEAASRATLIGTDSSSANPGASTLWGWPLTR